MTSLTELKEEQEQIWNGPMGKIWVENQDFIDGMIYPFEKFLVDKVVSLSPKNILDVGCGNGATSIAMARAIKPNGQCTGIDLSRSMIDNALSHLNSSDENVTFLCGDASDYAFDNTKFDVLTSRFGVMFFADPVAAFTNLRNAADNRAQLAILVWRGPEENEFMMAAKHAATPHLPELLPKEPTSPGPFSLAYPNHVHTILTKSGWTEINLEPIDLQCRFRSNDLDMFLTKLAPIGHDLETLEENIREKVSTAVRAAYEKFLDGTEVKFIASCWMISALVNEV
ncbi:MAG: class I SAM-dependent methyltransferase [Pseudomonadota bacterium]